MLTDMTIFSDLRIHRNSALVMLLVWTFALASGFANACLLEQPGTYPHAAITIPAEAHAPNYDSLKAHQHTEAWPDADDESQATGQLCLKVCDDSSRSLPKVYSSSQIDPGPPAVVAVLWSATAPDQLQHHQPNDAQRVTSSQPLRIRYARLAL